MPVDPDCVPIKVKDLNLGDFVDLESCPFLRHHAEAEFEFAIVDAIVHESDGCICVYYESGRVAGYDPEQVLMGERRGQDEESIGR